MVETKKIKSEKPGQVIKEGTEEKIKKKKLIEKLINKEFYLNHKRLFVFLIIGLLLIVGIYYIFDKPQDSASEEQQTEAAKDENGAEAVSPEGEVAEEEEKEEGIEEEEEGLPEEAGGEEGEEGEGESSEGTEGEEEGEGEEGGEATLPAGEEGEEWSYEPGPNDYLFESVGVEKIIDSVRIRLYRVESDTPKNFVVLEVGDALREKLEVGETRIIEGLSITLLEAHPEETPLESSALLRVEQPS